MHDCKVGEPHHLVQTVRNVFSRSLIVGLVDFSIAGKNFEHLVDV